MLIDMFYFLICWSQLRELSTSMKDYNIDGTLSSCNVQILNELNLPFLYNNSSSLLRLNKILQLRIDQNFELGCIHHVIRDTIESICAMVNISIRRVENSTPLRYEDANWLDTKIYRTLRKWRLKVSNLSKALEQMSSIKANYWCDGQQAHQSKFFPLRNHISWESLDISKI